MFLITDNDNNIKFVSTDAKKVIFDEAEMKYKDTDDENRWNAIFDVEGNTIYPRSLGYNLMEHIGDMPELEDGITYECYSYDGFGNFTPNKLMELTKNAIEGTKREEKLRLAKETGVQDAIEYLLMKVAELEGRL